MEFSEEDLQRAHKLSFNNRPSLANDSICGCFSCGAIFHPSEIDDWAPDRLGTAMCPHCYIDSVIGESSGFPITKEFLSAMCRRWFGWDLYHEEENPAQPQEKKYFDCNAWQKLVDMIKTRAASGDDDAREDLRFLRKAGMAFGNYVYQVIAEQMESRLAYGVLKGEELQQAVAGADRVRTAAHEQAIVNVEILNRLADAYEVRDIFRGDEADRYEVGEFCIAFCNWVFSARYE